MPRVTLKFSQAFHAYIETYETVRSKRGRRTVEEDVRNLVPIHRGELHLACPMTLQYRDREFGQWVCWIFQASAQPMRLEREHVAGVLASFQEKIFSLVSSRSLWPLDGKIDGRLGAFPDPVPVAEKLYELTREVTINAEFESQLQSWLSRLNEVEAAFTKARDYLLLVLREGNVFYYDDDKRQLTSAARFLAECMRRSADPGFYDTHPSVITAHVAELVARKNPNNHNFRVALSSARSAAYDSSFPLYWSEFPPAASSLGF